MLTDVPFPSQTLGQTNSPIRTNFTTIDNGFKVDHVQFGAAGVGFHQKVTFPDSTPAPAFLAGQMGLFNQTAAPTTRPDIWMARGISAAFPITGYDNGAISANTAVSWTYLPSGLKIIGGKSQTTAGTSGHKEITFTTSASGGLNSFPGFSSFIMFVGATRIDPSAPGQTFIAVKTFDLTKADFVNMNGGTASDFFWIAIGL